MFKIAGGIMVTAAAFFVFNGKVYNDYQTYIFLDKTIEVLKHIAGESSMNFTYSEVFEKIDFAPDLFISKASENHYILPKETKEVSDFFSQLGKRNRLAEQQYIKYYIEKFTNKKQHYGNRYRDNRKIYGIYGLSVGLMITLLLI